MHPYSLHNKREMSRQVMLEYVFNCSDTLHNFELLLPAHLEEMFAGAEGVEDQRRKTFADALMLVAAGHSK
jgi:hypothetical protein